MKTHRKEKSYKLFQRDFIIIARGIGCRNIFYDDQDREFVAKGVSVGKRPDLVGGGLVRSMGGWAAVEALH